MNIHLSAPMLCFLKLPSLFLPIRWTIAKFKICVQGQQLYKAFLHISPPSVRSLLCIRIIVGSSGNITQPPQNGKSFSCAILHEAQKGQQQIQQPYKFYFKNVKFFTFGAKYQLQLGISSVKFRHSSLNGYSTISRSQLFKNEYSVTDYSIRFLCFFNMLYLLIENFLLNFVYVWEFKFFMIFKINLML